MSKQWRCAVVGTGVVGSTHVKVLPLIPQAKLVAVCDAKREAAQASLNKAEVKDVPIYTDIGEMRVMVLFQNGDDEPFQVEVERGAPGRE